MTLAHFFEISNEVKEALHNKQPVLALESTVISHGLPKPLNLEIAIELENIARTLNVIPATIAVMEGKIKIGLSSEELEKFASHHSPYKTSAHHLSYAITKRLTAGTTVAASIFCAHLAGIRIFATGGIGGVHQGDMQDISADLVELAKTPVSVVCAGAKAILDLPRTLEFLETIGVPIIGFKTNTFPAFYTPFSDLKLDARIDDIHTLSHLLNIHWKLHSSSVIIANPIPEKYAISSEEINPIIHAAIQKAKQQNITGKSLTPYLLNVLEEATHGKSLKANIALLKNNVKLGAELAINWAKICISQHESAKEIYT